MSAPISLGTTSIDLDTWMALARPGSRIGLAADSRRAVQASRAVVDGVVAAGSVVYGVNTGFGKLAHVTVPPERLGDLQRNLLLSHATGVGAPLPVDYVDLEIDDVDIDDLAEHSSDSVSSRRIGVRRGFLCEIA